jgi:FAD/FMN-containing dehydrogenase
VGQIIGEVLKFKPESFESYDDKTLNLAIRFFPDILKRMKAGVFSLAVQFLPEFFMLLRGGLPKMVLLVELTGEDEKVLEQRLYELKGHLARFNVPVRVLRSEKESEKYWTIRRESFSLLRKHVQGKHTAPFIDDMAVKPEFLPEFLPAVNAILEPHRDKMIYTIQGHDGDGNFHIIPLMDFKDPATRKLIPKISEQIYDLVVKYKGSITAEHNDGLIRTWRRCTARRSPSFSPRSRTSSIPWTCSIPARRSTRT